MEAVLEEECCNRLEKQLGQRLEAPRCRTRSGNAKPPLWPECRVCMWRSSGEEAGGAGPGG